MNARQGEGYKNDRTRAAVGKGGPGRGFPNQSLYMRHCTCPYLALNSLSTYKIYYQTQLILNASLITVLNFIIPTNIHAAYFVRLGQG